MSLLLRAARGAILGAIGRLRPEPAAAGRRAACRGAVLWGAVAVVVANVGFVALADRFAPEVYDPEYGARLARLRAARAEHPDRPLLVVVGSSRPSTLFRPEQMAPLEAADGRPVLAVNLSRVAGGPMYSRFAYGRLRKQGLTPDFAVIELMPLLFVKKWELVFPPAATADELPDLAAYTSTERALKFYARNRYVAWRANRAGITRRFAPAWAIPFANEEPRELDRLGGDGRLPLWLPDDYRAEVSGRAAVRVKKLTADYAIDPGADRAMRDLLRECREAGTRAVLILAPESTHFQAAYQPGSMAVVNEYAARLARECGVSLVDARGWLPDTLFIDGDHPTLPGQALFTERLHREVLVPLVSGQ